MSGLIENEARCKKFKERCKELEQTIKDLQDNNKQTAQMDSKIIMALQKDKIKNQEAANRLDEALKSNEELMNIVQHKNTDIDLSRSNSQIELSGACSTMSIVHLQEKYEDLLISHQRLLKLLDLKTNEIKKVHKENVDVKIEIEQLKLELSESRDKIATFREKFLKWKNKKETRISKLKTHKETLKMAHNQLVNALHDQCLEKDTIISEQIRHCNNSDKALLLQEIKQNQLLVYENFQLNQQVEYLKSFVNFFNKTPKKDT